MVIADVKFFFMVIVFAYNTESKVIVLRDYDEEPLFLDHQDSGSREVQHDNHQVFDPDTNYKPKRIKPKQAILHYGRHIYHLDSFDDLTKLRSKLSKLNPGYISYGYIDLISDFIRSKKAKNMHPNHSQDVYVLSERPIRFECNDKHCDEDLRKFSKLTKKEDLYWQKKKMPLGHLKRFQIVDNTAKHKPQKKSRHKQIYTSSEESHEKKKKKYSSESSSSESRETKQSKESKESNESNESKEKSIESYEVRKKKKVYDSSFSNSEERYATKRPKKYNVQSQSSEEHWKNDSSDSKSEEDYHKRKKKRYDDSEETKRKTFGNDDMVLQGNKMYHANNAFRPKKHMKNDVDRRRRLQHFLPKRYHWKASEIHDLGYYWFNGPRGRYPAPTSLPYKKK